jgi:hypothetical protein
MLLFSQDFPTGKLTVGIFETQIKVRPQKVNHQEARAEFAKSFGSHPQLWALPERSIRIDVT